MKNLPLLIVLFWSLVGVPFESVAQTFQKPEIVGYSSKEWNGNDGIVLYVKLVSENKDVVFVQGHQKIVQESDFIPLNSYAEFSELLPMPMAVVQLDDYTCIYDGGDRKNFELVYKSNMHFMVPRALEVGTLVEGAEDLIVALEIRGGMVDVDREIHAILIPAYKLGDGGKKFENVGQFSLSGIKIKKSNDGSLSVVSNDSVQASWVNLRVLPRRSKK